MTTRELWARRGELQQRTEAILRRAESARRALSASEQAEFDRLIAESRTIASRLEHESIGAELSESRGRKTGTYVEGQETREQRGASDRTLSDALRGWALGKRASSEQRAAAEGLGLDPDNPELELRALGSGAAPDAGPTVANEAIRAFEQYEKWFGPVRSLATVMTTATGALLPVPTVDDTGNTAEIIAEHAAITTTADPVFGAVNLKPFQYASKALVVAVQVLQDSAISLDGVLLEALAKRIGRKQNADFTIGAGTTLPFGIQVQATLGKTAAATNAITWDEVLDLQSACDPAYANRPGAGFMMHPTIANYLRKLKDSQNRYVWQMDLQGPSPGQANLAGVAGRIVGFPVYLNESMDSTLATNKRLVLFGAFSAYWIQDAGGPILRRADELRLLNNEVVFVAFRRSDGALVNPEAVKYLRTA